MGGTLIGPAWQAAWDALADGEWHPLPTLVDQMQRASTVAEKTAQNLMRAARQAGLVEVRYVERSDSRYRAVQYRLVPV